MKAVMQTLFILLLASLTLGGCGQKGDLFLPATPPPVATPAEPVTQPEAKQPSQPAIIEPTTKPNSELQQHQDAAHQSPAPRNVRQNPILSSDSAQTAVPAHSAAAQPNATKR